MTTAADIEAEMQRTLNAVWSGTTQPPEMVFTPEHGAVMLDSPEGQAYLKALFGTVPITL